MKITISKDKCISAGQCVRAAPKIFSQDENDGCVALVQPTPPAELHDAARNAERLCPTQVIHISEDTD